MGRAQAKVKKLSLLGQGSGVRIRECEESWESERERSLDDSPASLLDRWQMTKSLPGQ